MRLIVSLFIILFLTNKIVVGQIVNEKSDSLLFSGYWWTEKRKSKESGPGPNYYGLHRRNVYVDKKGSLHLKIRKKNSIWSCAEILTNNKVYEGTYEVCVKGIKSNISKNIVLGLFIYDEENPPSYNEIDIEVSYWDKYKDTNCQHVLFSDTLINVNRFNLSLHEDTKHIITITDTSVSISSYIQDTNYLLHHSSFNRPKELQFHDARFRMNLWIFEPEKHKTKRAHMVITSFKYNPFEF